MSFYHQWSYDEANAAMFANLQEHDRMLADMVRLEPYYRAINKHVEQGDVVIDLGTGTGILSFIAAAKRPKRIYAVDHSSIIEVARSVAKHNGIENIEFISVNSRNLELDEKADVIIHEQIGDFLFEEKMIENVIDLRDRLLKPSGKILPGRFELYIEPVMMREEYHVPFIWEHSDLFGVDFSCIKERYRDIAGDSYHYHGIAPYQVEKVLSASQSALTFDLRNVGQDDIPRRLQLTRVAETDGRLDGFVLFFKVGFDDEIFFSNSPLGRDTSWVGRLLRVESRPLREGQSIGFEMSMDYISDPDSWYWSVS